MIITPLFDFVLNGYLVDVLKPSYDVKDGFPVFTSFHFKVRKIQTQKQQSFFTIRSHDRDLYDDMVQSDKFRHCVLYLHCKVTGTNSYVLESISKNPFVAYQKVLNSIIQHSAYYDALNPSEEPYFDLLVREYEESFKNSKKNSKPKQKSTKK